MIVSFLCAFLGGALIAAGGFWLSRRVLKNRPERYGLVSVARTAAAAAFLAALFFLGQKTSLPSVPLLLGGALGVTLPSLALTVLLLRQAPGNRPTEGGEPNG